MKIYQLSVPVTNYTNDGIFFQEMFIISSRSPTNQVWLELAKEYHFRDCKYPEYTNDWRDTVQAIEQAVVTASFPSLHSNMVQCSGHILTQYGNQPITLTIRYAKVMD